MKKIIFLVFLFSLIQGCSAYDVNVNKVKNFPPAQEMKIAVLPFIAPPPQTIKTVGGIETTLSNAGALVADSIASAMIGIPNIILIERSQLEKLLNEHELSLSGVINNPDFTLLGKILHVDALVVGNITSFYRFQNIGAWGGCVAYSARMVNIRTGEVMFAINGNIGQHYVLPEKLANDLARDAIKKLLEK
jgi:hypothetical protein